MIWRVEWVDDDGQLQSDEVYMQADLDQLLEQLYREGYEATVTELDE